MEAKLFKHIARKLDAYIRCNESPDSGWTNIHRESIESLVNGYMPSGSGIDAGTSFDFAHSEPNKLVFTFSYHHINENGYYDGWTEHKCIITPNLWSDFDMKITGSNRNDCKEYFYQVFDYSLRQDVDV